MCTKNVKKAKTEIEMLNEIAIRSISENILIDQSEASVEIGAPKKLK